jgi:glycosyltransferase involved in cell wall biosynthesis
MKVLHVIPGVAPRYGGPSQAVLEMCRALGDAGAEVLLATTDADGPGVLTVELEREIVYEGVPAIFFHRQFSEAFKYSRPLKKWLDMHAGGFDLLHIHAVFSHACLAAARAARRARVPYIVRPLGTLDPWSLQQKRLRKQLFWRLGVKEMLTGAAAIHYTAQAERELAESSLGLKNGVVIPLGLEVGGEADAEAVFRARYPQLGASPYVLMLSRLHPKKGQDLLLKAFFSLRHRPELADWKVLLVGEGEAGYTAELHRLVREHQAEEQVIFTGWLSGAQKNAALKYAGLLALPSQHENFGLCVIESLAWGVPVLVSDQVNIAPDVAAGGVGWVSRLDAEELSGHLANALQSETSRRNKGLAGLEFVKRYCWPQIADELLALYCNLAAIKPTG